MKHPCGKEFDCNKAAKRRAGNYEIKVVNQSLANLRVCGFNLAARWPGSLSFTPYQDCGHFYNTHIDSDFDLINVPEEKNEIKEKDIITEIKLNASSVRRILHSFYFVDKRDPDAFSYASNKLDNILNLLNELEKLNARD